MFNFLIGLALPITLGCLNETDAVMMDGALETDNRPLVASIVNSGACGVLSVPIPVTITAVTEDTGEVITIEVMLKNGRPFWTHIGAEFANSLGSNL